MKDRCERCMWFAQEPNFEKGTCTGTDRSGRTAVWDFAEACDQFMPACVEEADANILYSVGKGPLCTNMKGAILDYLEKQKTLQTSFTLNTFKRVSVELTAEFVLDTILKILDSTCSTAAKTPTLPTISMKVASHKFTEIMLRDYVPVDCVQTKREEIYAYEWTFRHAHHFHNWHQHTHKW